MRTINLVIFAIAITYRYMTLLLLFFFLSIIASFLCSVWEAVLLSITPSYVNTKVQSGSTVGVTLERFKNDIDRPLSAILTLNTIAHTVGAIGVGDQASKIWSEANPLITSLVIPVLMTLAILVLSELIPKTLGANYWKELAPFTARSLDLIIRLLAPNAHIVQGTVDDIIKCEKSYTAKFLQRAVESS